MFTGEQSDAIDHPMRGDTFGTHVHGPPYHARAGLQSQVAGDGTVTGHPAFWNKFCDFIDILEEIVDRLLLFNACHLIKTLIVVKFTVVYPT